MVTWKWFLFKISGFRHDFVLTAPVIYLPHKSWAPAVFSAYLTQWVSNILCWNPEVRVALPRDCGGAGKGEAVTGLGPQPHVCQRHSTSFSLVHWRPRHNFAR